MLRLILRYFLAPIAICRINKIDGLENLPSKGPYLIVANHISYLDPPLIGALVAKRTGQKIHFISKHELFRYFGRRIGEKWLGMIYIDPSDKQKCLKTAVDLFSKEK